MESSQLFGGPEECHSSESGWTMYLGSPIHGGDDDDENDDKHSNKDDDDEDENGGNDKNHYIEDDSDDSMTSDASSGPNHQGSAHYKLQKHVDDNKHLPEKKQENQQKAERGMIKKWDLLQEDHHNKNAPAQSSSKVRKSISLIGKRN